MESGPVERDGPAEGRPLTNERPVLVNWQAVERIYGSALVARVQRELGEAGDRQEVVHPDSELVARR